MANINPNAAPGQQVFNTKIPDFADKANIQEALRMYHYGDAFESPPALNSNIDGGIALHLKNAYDAITALQIQGIGSAFSPTIPTNLTPGYIWVDSNSSALQSFSTRVVYQNSQPTEGLFSGLLWIDKDSTPLKMYVYDEDMASWREIGA